MSVYHVLEGLELGYCFGQELDEASDVDVDVLDELDVGGGGVAAAVVAVAAPAHAGHDHAADPGAADAVVAGPAADRQLLEPARDPAEHRSEVVDGQGEQDFRRQAPDLLDHVVVGRRRTAVHGQHKVLGQEQSLDQVILLLQRTMKSNTDFSLGEILL